MSENAPLQISNLNVYYGSHRALKDVSVTFPARSITAIIGPSGCGKSTLLKSCNRLIDLVEGVRYNGAVLVDGENILDPRIEVTRLRSRMGLLSQKPVVLPMSIYDNVAYGPRIHGMRRRTMLDAVVEESLKAASLWEEVRDRLHKPASRLSLGQQQRLCLARGLAVRPQIILGDEPTSALDPQSSRHIEEHFLRLKSEYTIIFVTHILRQARRLADYVVFMYLGEVIEAGNAHELFDNPRHELTRNYMQGVIS